MKATLTLALALSLMGTVASAQTSSTAAGTSTITSKAQSEVEKWDFKYQNYTNGPAFKDPSGSSINHYLDLGRKVGNWTVAGVARYDSKWTHNEDQENIKADHYLKLITPKAVPGGKTTINGNIRYYAPTGQTSKDAGQEFAVEPRVYVISNDVANNELSYILIPKFHGYEAATDGQAMVDFVHYFNVAYSLTPKVTLDLGLQPGWTFKRNEEKPEYNNCPIYPGFTANFTDNFSVGPYLEIFASRPKYTTSSVGAFVSYQAF